MASENMYIQIRAVDNASATMRRVAMQTKASGSMMSSAGLAAGRAIATGLKFGAVGAVALGAASVKTSMDFTKTMNTMKAVAGVPAPALEHLRDLAIDLGASTVFSANEAGEAMLELAKAGIAPADIQAGALANTLSLATAGDLELADAATVAANAMNVFGLSGEDSQRAVDALAGAANASSADVDQLAMSLAQGGLAAANAGLSIEETTAVLAAFADAGLKGSDAGTSLKTFMLSLVPSTERASTAMKDLGIDFVDAQGNILPMAGIADELQGGLKGLTQAEQQLALKTMFGTDAFRAATIVAKEGADGLAKYQKETSKTGTAAEVAAAKMEGLPGAIERLKGAAETAMLTLGDALAPAVESVANGLSDLINWATEGEGAFQKMVGWWEGASEGAKGLTIAIGGVTAALALMALASANPFMAALVVLAGVGVLIAKNWDVIGPVVERVWNAIKPLADILGGALYDAITGVADVIMNDLWPAFVGIWNAIKPLVTIIAGVLFVALIGLLKILPTVAKLFSLQFKVLAAGIGIISNVVGAIVRFVMSIPAMLASLPGKIASFFAAIPGVILGFFTALPGMILSALSTLGQFLWTAFTTALKFAAVAVLAGILALYFLFFRLPGIIGRAVAKLPGILARLGAAALRAFGAAIKAAVPAIISFVASLPGKIVRGLVALGKLLFNAGREALKFLLNAVKTGAIAVFNFFKELPGKIIDFVKKLPGMMIQAGKDVISGFLDGIQAMWSSVTGWISQQLNNLPGIVKKALGIGSPSKVFRDLGKEIPRGFAQGIRGEFHTAQAAMDELAGIRPGSSGFRVRGAHGKLGRGAMPEQIAVSIDRRRWVAQEDFEAKYRGF